ncbi:MAG: pilus assembly protein N-terminal domain-containing protein [Candidatus Binatus sp.]|uniref:type II and III secretion system protein family protein n=1 Tax=Candidatus Binatus sp. TaxID=2811406 RepID=UPI0027200344|nr:pilus assembly protein N-terminal domain-containing protein [Candidatus Binatus sp.]MDO8432398.1 pilus assembly protein N-terminal domain-containing protein [Candidatus Binatus sp.]
MKFHQIARLALANRLPLLICGVLIAIAPAPALGQPAPIAVSINAGESFSIDHIKAGATPAIRVLQNPYALVVNAVSPHKLVLIGAEAGRWAIDVTEDSGRVATYDVRVAAIAKPGAPLSPGYAPPASTDANLAPRPGAGLASSGGDAAPPASTDMNLTPRAGAGLIAPGTETAPPEVVTIPGAGSSARPDDRAPTQDASWSLPALPSRSTIPAVGNQSIGKLETREGQYRTDPSILGPDSGYTTVSVSGGKHYLPDDAVSVVAGSSEIIDFKRRLTRISIADSKIADVQVINPYQINLIGHAPGFTTIALWDADGSYNERQVRVDPNGSQQVLLNTIVAELDRTGIENQGVNVSVAFLNSGISFVSLPGNVGTPYSGTSSSPGSITTLPPAGRIIPMLLSQNLTYGLATQGSGVATQSFFQFLEQHDLARILAEPHLLANSGEKAKFLSGGEIPIVIAQALNSTIVFKQFGTSVEFIPTVVGRNDIELLVKPEVSQPDYAHGVQLFGFTVPAFVTRRAETLVRLKDRQTLIIAGLILHEKLSTVQKVPYLGDIPYLGAAFRSTYWESKETDLVMSVTPEIVRPLPAAAEVFLPGARGPMTEGEVKTRQINPPDPSRPRF